MSDRNFKRVVVMLVLLLTNISAYRAGKAVADRWWHEQMREFNTVKCLAEWGESDDSDSTHCFDAKGDEVSCKPIPEAKP